MGIGSLGTLARERRHIPPPGWAVPGQAGAPTSEGPTVPPPRPSAPRPRPEAPGGTGLSRFEQAIPTEIIAFYTGVITACEAVLSDRPERTFAEFRLAVFLVALALTVVLAGRATRTAVDGWMAVGRAPEWWTATLSFLAWGLALPGSFLYVWLDRDVLTVTIATVTAGTALVLGLGTSPRLQQDDPAS